MTAKETANVVRQTHEKNIDSRTLQQLNNFDLEATQALIQGTLASISTDEDPTCIANESFTIAQTLKKYTQDRITLLTRQPSTSAPSIAGRILAAASPH